METEKQTPPKKSTAMLPVSIIVSGLIIAGALVYSSGSRPAPKFAATAAPQSGFDFVALAKNLSLDTQKFQTCTTNRTYKDAVQKDLEAGITIGIDGTPTTIINGTTLAGAAPFSEYKKVIDAALKGTVGTTNVGTGGNAVLGSANAPVTMIIFGDFQCPYCRQAYDTAEKQVRDTYVKDGKVKMVFRDFPLDAVHKSARPAAEAARCAGEQGRYWDYHDGLYDNQDQL